LLHFNLIVWLLALTAPGCVSPSSPQVNQVETLSVRVINKYPHDPGAFTQGLIWFSGRLYESTGRYGQSSLRKVRLRDGKVLRKVSLHPRYFGEGLARVGSRLIQLTWRENTAFTYDLTNLRQLGKIPYSGDGWGLTFDGTWLVMSDGSSLLTFRDPRTFSVWKRLQVTLNKRPVQMLNELEFAGGWIYANVWTRTEIMKIHPETGRVVAIIDASGLPYQPVRQSEDVLNGIAYIPERKTFLLTGKLWPKIFEVVFEK